MTTKEMRDFADRYPWTFAKTYADKAPHEYIVKDKLDAAGKKDFASIVVFVRDNGFDCRFWGYTYIYYELDGRYYWTMGEPVEETAVLNRCQISEYEINDGEMKWRKGHEG